MEWHSPRSFGSCFSQQSFSFNASHKLAPHDCCCFKTLEAPCCNGVCVQGVTSHCTLFQQIVGSPDATSVVFVTECLLRLFVVCSCGMWCAREGPYHGGCYHGRPKGMQLTVADIINFRMGGNVIQLALTMKPLRPCVRT